MSDEGKADIGEAAAAGDVFRRAMGALENAARQHKQASKKHRLIGQGLLRERQVLIDYCNKVGLKFTQSEAQPKEAQPSGQSTR